jgi:hypothetical protein
MRQHTDKRPPRNSLTAYAERRWRGTIGWKPAPVVAFQPMPFPDNARQGAPQRVGNALRA